MRPKRDKFQLNSKDTTCNFPAKLGLHAAAFNLKMQIK